jgi:hypothetical protein
VSLVILCWCWSKCPFLLGYGATSAGNQVPPFRKAHFPYRYSTQECKDITLPRNLGTGLRSFIYHMKGMPIYILQKPPNYVLYPSHQNMKTNEPDLISVTHYPKLHYRFNTFKGSARVLTYLLTKVIRFCRVFELRLREP